MTSQLHAILQGDLLSSEAAQEAMDEILGGNVPPELIGAFLSAFHFRVPQGREIAGFVRAFRKRMIPIIAPAYERKTIVDVCGTGGDGQCTFNVSTSVAFVVAACGLRVAKHGNRSVSSQSGSFDLLAALGVPFANTPAAAESALKNFGLAFLFAPDFHPALRDLAGLRRSLGFRTIFNLLGPLLNPMRVERQLVGVYSAALVLPVAEALAELGSTDALVVSGDDGSDELSLCGPSTAALLRNGRIQILRLHPNQAGLSIADSASLLGGNPGHNAQITKGIFRGEHGPRREFVALNAGAALLIGGMAENLRDGVFTACNAIDNGSANHLLERMKKPTIQEVAL